jgi:hypothetical protein
MFSALLERFIEMHSGSVSDRHRSAGCSIPRFEFR